MKTVIFAGGLGSRLGEETALKPKPMVEIGGKPIIWYIMKHYAKYGFEDFVILLGYKGSMIKDYFLNYSLYNSNILVDLESGTNTFLTNQEENWKVTLLDTGEKTMTAGRLKQAKDIIGNETFMMTYGDGVSDINLDELLNFHKGHNGCISLSSVQPEGKWGALEEEKDGLITKFSEKVKGDGSWINGGFFVCDNEIFDYIQGQSNDVMFESEPLEKLAKDKQLYAYRHSGFWKCMDTLKDKNDLESMLESNSSPWITW